MGAFFTSLPLLPKRVVTKLFEYPLIQRIDMPLLEHYLYIQAELANDSIWRVSPCSMIALEAKTIDPLH